MIVCFTPGINLIVCFTSGFNLIVCFTSGINLIVCLHQELIWLFVLHQDLIWLFVLHKVELFSFCRCIYLLRLHTGFTDRWSIIFEMKAHVHAQSMYVQVSMNYASFVKRENRTSWLSHEHLSSITLSHEVIDLHMKAFL